MQGVRMRACFDSSKDYDGKRGHFPLELLPIVVT